ncbi:Oligomeric complex COG6 [Rhizoctonia solani]|uniref:Conserved oligomeric Golgi complex subunit 6 n=1 Tax=Rhizoctonia solani TaxID=456999 RepID=A0A8H7I8A9_9AGAM|nr:Oligomeric complex COG6 [Rhizoctonia solani]
MSSPISSVTPKLNTSSLSPGNRRTSSAASPATRNPLSLRIYKVLGANFDDPSTREAFEALVDSKATAGADSDSDTENENDPWAVKWPTRAQSTPVVGLGPGTTAARARQNLQRDVEGRLADGGREFLEAFGEVDKKLDVLRDHVQVMNLQCEAMETRLRTTNQSCKYLLERAEGLRAQQQTTNTRQEIIALFLDRFTLSAAELEAITSRDIPVGKQMFDAMDKLERIREDCRVLMTGEGGETKAGLDIMSSTSEQLEEGFRKLHRWCLFEFRQLGRDAHVEVEPLMAEAVRRLRKRPALLQESLDVLASVRQATLLNAFLAALTRGGPAGLPRPIELHAHDPTRYVGDMLAWAMAGEREFLDGLFGIKAERRMVGSVREPKSGEEESWIRVLMDEDLEKLCTPLKVRVQQTIRSQEGSITSYKIANLLEFYMIIMRRTVGEEAILSRALSELTEIAYTVFFDTLAAHGRSLLRFLHPAEDDLAAPISLRDAAQVLKEIMAVYDSSLLRDEHQGGISLNGEMQNFDTTLAAMVDPMLEMCRRMAALREKGEKGEKWETAIFMINCLTYLQGVLQGFSFTAARASELDQLIDEYQATLTEEHFEDMLNESGLQELYKHIDSKSPEEPLSRLPGASGLELTAVLTSFDAFLSILDPISSPRLGLLRAPNPRIATRIHQDALERVGRVYLRVVEEVRAPKNKYEAPQSLLGSRHKLTIKPASKAQVVEAGTRSSVEWAKWLTLEQYLKRDEESLAQYHANEGKLISWVLVPKDDPETLDFFCACETYKRDIFVLPKGQITATPKVGYGVASVFTPARHRGKGYASRMMSLLHFTIAELGGIPPFPSTWGSVPPVRVGQPGQVSVLYSDVGKFYERCAPGEGVGWTITSPMTTEWIIGIDDDEAVPNGVELLSQDEAIALVAGDLYHFKKDLESRGPSERIHFGFQPTASWCHFQMHRDDEHPLYISSPPSIWGAKTKTKGEIHFVVWQYEALPKPRLIILYSRATPETFPGLLAAAKSACLREKHVAIEAWNLDEALGVVAEELGGRTYERTEHLPAMKWYGEPGEIVWVGNNKIHWC